MQKGTYLQGDMIPTEKELSEFFNLSRTTVRQAITELVQEGRLYRIKSKGTFIAKPKIKQDFIKRLETFNEQIERLGMKPSTKLIDIRVVPADEDVANALKIGEGESCIRIIRERYADGEPNVVVRTFLPYEKCRFVMQHDMEKESLYEILSKQEQTKIFRVNRIGEAMLANEEDSKLLKINIGQPIHFFTSIGYNSGDQPIEYSLARYRGDRNRFEVDLFYDNDNHK
jgi:GntR family transcriptional regulator